jgi:hypothetical protein
MVPPVGDPFECCLDDEQAPDVEDDTSTKAGKVGLWTKADAQRYFEELKIMDK